MIRIVAVGLTLALALVPAIATALAPNPAWPAVWGVPIDFSSQIPSVPTRGSIPEWLTGTVYRNGPANFQNLTDLHWFNGWALLHAFKFRGDGTLSYTAKYVASTGYNQTRGSEHANPCKRVFGSAASRFVPAAAEGAETAADGAFSPNTLVTIRQFVDENGKTEYLTNTAIASSNAFDPVTLDTTAAPYAFADALPTTSFTPEHAQTGPDGTVYNWIVSFGDYGAPGYYPYAIRPNTNSRVLLGGTGAAPVPASAAFGVPTYQHSFGLTPHHMIITEVPCVFGQSGFDSFTFFPAVPVTWRIVSLTTGQQTHTFTSAAQFMMHHVQAFEDAAANALVVDLLTYPDASLLDGFYLDQIQNNYTAATIAAIAEARLQRFTLPLSSPGATVTPVTLSNTPFELPTINPLKRFESYRYAYGVGIVDPKQSGFFDSVVKVDVTTGQTSAWQFGPNGVFPGEPLFVPRPASAGGTGAEDDGLLLTVVFEPSRGASGLVLLNAADLTEVGRAELPTLVPLGFHGRYYDV